MTANVCFWHLADITIVLNHVRLWGVKRTSVGLSEIVLQGLWKYFPACRFT